MTLTDEQIEDVKPLRLKIVEVGRSDGSPDFLLADAAAPDSSVMAGDCAAYAQVADRLTAEIIVRSVHEYPALLSALEAEKKRADEAEALVERLKREAVQHAQEARTANATIAEIYRAVTGGSGEPGNWQGAEPIKAELTRLREALKLAEQMMTKSSLCDDERLDEGLSVIRRALKENSHDKG